MTGWTYNLHFLQNFWLPLDLMNWFMTPWWFAQFAWMNNDVSRLIIVDWLLLFSERLAENFATSACDLKMSYENCLHDVEMKLSSKWGENFSESILTVHAVYSDSRLCSRLVNRRLGHRCFLCVLHFPWIFELAIVLQLWMWTFLYFSDWIGDIVTGDVTCRRRRRVLTEGTHVKGKWTWLSWRTIKWTVKSFILKLQWFCAKRIWLWCDIRTLKSDIFCCILTWRVLGKQQFDFISCAQTVLW